MPLKKILSATDFSECAQMAVERAALLAADHGAQLYVLHIASLPALDALLSLFGSGSEVQEKILSECRERLAEITASLHEKYQLEVVGEVRQGNVATALLQAATALEVDLIVLGAQGENRLREILLGTTAERIVGKTRLPVLVVRRYSAAPYRHVLMPIDFSGYSLPAFRLGRDISPAGEMTLLHAFELPFESRLRHAGVDDDVMKELLSEARRECSVQLDQLVREDSADGMINRVVLHGPIARRVIEQAEIDGVDLVVMGRHGRTSVEELLFGTVGSVTHHVLIEVPCDVLISTSSITEE